MLGQRALKRRPSPGRLQRLSTPILQIDNPKAIRTRLTPYWQMWQRNHAGGHEAEAIRIYRDTCIIIPERWKDNPMRRQLVFGLKS